MENKSCKNCKHFIEDESGTWGTCGAPVPACANDELGSTSFMINLYSSHESTRLANECVLYEVRSGGAG